MSYWTILHRGTLVRCEESITGALCGLYSYRGLHYWLDYDNVEVTPA